ncbi:MAG TPA: phage holin family protein [Clostridia bacterium]|nr:phage holin family protein [Clostridia bacterium]
MRNIFWNYGNDGLTLSGAVALIGTFFNWALGGFDKMLLALILFMALDFLLGFLAAWKGKRINSQAMFWGGINKLLVLAFVAVGSVLDWLLGIPDPYIRTGVIWFYIGRELLSITENYGNMGMKLPPFISEVLEQINSKSKIKKENDK